MVPYLAPKLREKKNPKKTLRVEIVLSRYRLIHLISCRIRALSDGFDVERIIQAMSFLESTEILI